MNQQYFATVGSGSVPHTGHGPAHGFTPGAYPGAHSKEDLRTRVGDGAIILNPEDFSVNIGLSTQAIIVATSALPLPATPLEYRRALVVHNAGDVDVFLGSSNVTTANGMPLAAGEKIAFDIQGNPNVEVYAVCATSADVRIMELA